MDPELEQPLEQSTEVEPTRFNRKIILFAIVADVLIIIGGLLWWLSSAPNYSDERMVTVTPGQSVSQIVNDVAAAGVVRSESFLYILTQLYYQDETIKTGTYTFTTEQNVFEVAHTLMTTTPADELVSLTIPEGITNEQVARIVHETLPHIATSTFIEMVADGEGSLWPETYFVPLDYSLESVVTLLEESQDEVLALQQAAIASSTLSEYEILILASILEREANDAESMGLVAGILLNRLSIGMALQADATIAYVLEDAIGNLPPGMLAEQLREVDSPYNTYKYPGLPPTPIGNPGLVAIEAVLEPTPSEYLYYLTDDAGTFHYAETYEQHLININRYLR